MHIIEVPAYFQVNHFLCFILQVSVVSWIYNYELCKPFWNQITLQISLPSPPINPLVLGNWTIHSVVLFWEFVYTQLIPLVFSHQGVYLYDYVTSTDTSMLTTTLSSNASNIIMVIFNFINRIIIGYQN